MFGHAHAAQAPLWPHAPQDLAHFGLESCGGPARIACRDDGATDKDDVWLRLDHAVNGIHSDVTDNRHHHMAQLLVELTQHLEWCGVPSLSQVRDLAKLRTVGTEARWHNDGPDAQCLELERTRHVALYAGEVTHDMASVLLRHAEHRAKGLTMEIGRASCRERV